MAGFDIKNYAFIKFYNSEITITIVIQLSQSFMISFYDLIKSEVVNFSELLNSKGVSQIDVYDLI